MTTTKQVQRGVAHSPIVGIIPSQLLVAVDLIIGDIEVNDDLPRRAFVAFNKQLHKQTLYGSRLMTNAVITTVFTSPDILA